MDMPPDGGASGRSFLVKMDKGTSFPAHNIYIIHNSLLQRKHLIVNPNYFLEKYLEFFYEKCPYAQKADCKSSPLTVIPV